MANYLQLGQALAKHLPMTEGCTSTVKLSKKGIEALAKKNPEFGKAIAEVTEGVANPTLEVAQKAQGNYAIAGFKIKNGETVIGKGAYSTSAGTNGTVEKMHFEKGDIIANVFREGSANPVTKEVSKAELARIKQEKAKASEFMTKELPNLNPGERILRRKLKNGNVIETLSRTDGSICTTVTKPDGNWYSRNKIITSTDLSPEETNLLKKFFPSHFNFKRIEVQTSMLNKAGLGKTGSVKMPKKGRIYGTNIDSKNFDNELIVKYEGVIEGVSPLEGKTGYDIHIINPYNKNKTYDGHYRFSSQEDSLVIPDKEGKGHAINKTSAANIIGEDSCWISSSPLYRKMLRT